MIINLLLIVAISFFAMNFINALKTWKTSKQYNYFFKGIIDNIRLDNDKIFFKIKWGVPTALKTTLTKEDCAIQFYDHYVETIPKKLTENQRQTFMQVMSKKYLDKSFSLQAKIINNTISDITPFRGNGVNVFINLLIVLLLMGLLVYKTQIK